MFPLPWNFPFRKKDGTVVNVEDAISGGGGSDLPDYDSSDAGKILGVDENGDLEWSDSIVNSYVFKGADSITVTSEDNDTWDTMLEKSRVAINNYLANLGNNEYVRFIALSGAYSGISQIYDLKKKNDAFSGSFLVNGFTNSYTTAVLMLIRIAASNRAAIRTTSSTSTGESSTASLLSDSFASGLTMTYLIYKFVKI